MIAIDGIGLASRILSAVAMAASTDETRPHLNSVLVRVRKNVLEVVATNGHILAHYTGKNEVEDCEVLIPLAVVEKIAKASRKAPIVSIDPKTCTARVYDGASSVFEWQKVQTTFPPFEQVTPQRGIVPDVGLEGFAVSTEYLIVAGKMFALLENTKQRSVGVYIELPKDDLSPIVLSSASIPQLVLVVMPNREGRGPSRKVEKPTKVKAA
jgi:DNA polymerase III sliding clamp (beta) subunit (PCNA family)